MLDWLERLCADDTTTGREDQGLPALRELSSSLGARIETFEIAPGRHNVLASWGEPRLVFSTHLDTVPPFLPPRREKGLLRGRGACDAKGQIAAHFAVIRALLEAGERRLAWLGVVGEETDSIGAKRALELTPRFRATRAIINGEPTGNVLGTGQRGVLHLKLATRGVAAHSGTPERGRSAVWPLLEWIERVRGLPTGVDAELGPEIWNLGLLSAGSAPNVVPAQAEAHIFVRALPESDFEQRVRALAPEESSVEVLTSTPPDRYPSVPGHPHGIVPFGSDAPRLRELVPSRTIALVGPGRIELAHSEQEHITEQELTQGFARLHALARHFLGEPAS